MQKFHPILYSTPMVQSILEKRKTKTRRTKGLEIVNDNPDRYVWLNDYPQIDIPRQAIPYDDKFYYAFTGKHNNSFLNVVTCPYGKVGDVLWVRETFLCYSDENGNDAVLYKAEPHADEFSIGLFEGKPKWKPCIFMPKEACRIFLEITDIRIERLQDISEEDAIKEGIEIISHGGFGRSGEEWKNYLNGGILRTAIISFGSLWQKINGLKSWQANPFVWVIEFKQIDKPENFNHGTNK